MNEIPTYLKKVSTNIDSNKLEIQLGAKILEQIFVRSSLYLYQQLSTMSPSFTLSCLTINRGDVKFTNIQFRSKIQVSGNAHIIAEGCTFAPFDSLCECSIEMYTDSFGDFYNCNFINGNKASIAIRDNSEANFTDCTFSNNSNASLLVMDKSKANVDNCAFKTADRFSIYIYRNSVITIKNTIFSAQNAKAIFILNGSQAHIIKCQFNSCNGGGVSIADSSDAYIDRCTFKNLGSSSIHAIKNSVIEIKKCFIQNCKGNGVNFEYSTGYVYKSVFTDLEFPAIACFGPKTTPVIYDSKIKNCQSFAAVSRDCATPLFSKLFISNIKLNGFSISDFSNAVVENCVLKNIDSIPFSVFNGAEPTIKNCYISIENDNDLFQVFTDAKISFNENVVLSDNDNLTVKIKNFGEIKRNGFVGNKYYQKIQKQLLGHLMSIDDEKRIIINQQNIDNSFLDKNIFIEEENENIENDILNDNEEIIYQKEAIIPKPQPTNISIFSFMKRQKRLDKVLKPSDLPNPLPEIKIEAFMRQKYPEENENLDFNQKENEILNNQKENEILNNQNENEILNNQNENHIHHHNDNEGNHIHSCDCGCCCGDVDASTAGHMHLGICMRCKKNPADHVISPCGHKVLCKECANECKTNINPEMNPEISHFCPLCDLPIRGCTEEFVEDKCVICLDHKPDTVILPCGHRCICYECAVHLWTEKRQCPLCQTRFLSFRHVFKIFPDEETINKTTTK